MNIIFLIFILRYTIANILAAMSVNFLEQTNFKRNDNLNEVFLENNN